MNVFHSDPNFKMNNTFIKVTEASTFDVDASVTSIYYFI